MKHKIIYKTIVGSQSYGTNTPNSDVDYKGVYIQDKRDILSFKYKQQVDVGKDEVYYEIRRFLELVQSANPTLLEMLYSPDFCVLETSPEFEIVKNHRDKFLTKMCRNSFGGFAVAQIKKAKGLDKKMNWENKRVSRKSPIDFAYAYIDGKTMPVKKWLELEDRKQEFCGLTKLNHFKDCYALYYDYSAQYGKEYNRKVEDLKFKGLIADNSNSFRLSSIPKYMSPETVIYYNKDGYSQHCKDYREYQEWLDNRNEQRYVDIKAHDQKIDGKNMLHCRRLLDMAKEIAIEGTLNVLRPNAEYLLSIRRGEVELDDIIAKAEEDILELDELYEKADLPDKCDFEFVNSLLLEVREFNS